MAPESHEILQTYICMVGCTNLPPPPPYKPIVELYFHLLKTYHFQTCQVFIFKVFFREVATAFRQLVHGKS